MPEQRSAYLERLNEHVTVLRLNRPEKLNALADETVDIVVGLLGAVAKSSARVLILTGNGRGFCSGFDLSLAENAGETDEGDETAAWMARQERYAGMVTKLRNIPQPTLAAVNGASCGAGFGLALACDMRIAGKSAKFNSAFIKVGMSSCDIGVSYLLPRAIGTTHAFEMMLTGRMVMAEEAHRIGLVSSLHEDADLMTAAETLAGQVAANGGLSTWMTKRGMWANLEAGSLATALELENRTQILMRGTGGLQQRAAERGFLPEKK